MMKLTQRIATLGAAVVMGAAGFAPMVAQADDQKNKNDWRNLGGAAGAVAIYGLTKHDTLTTVLGAAGAAYSAKRYEDARKSQAAQSRARYHRSGSSSNSNRSYYYYRGHEYYLENGERHLVR